MTTPDRVLIVEDEPALRSMLSIMFMRGGWDVTAVENGHGALDVADGRHDLVLLDLGLAGVNGLEVCRRLRARPETSRVPIVMVTGRDDPRDVRDGLAAGADAFVTKPFDLVGLMRTVNRLLRHNAGSSPPDRSASRPARTPATTVRRPTR
jgi:DNA-binding response OmpR family regulator